ncbi:helix-turn-helix protein [Streptomyces sp. SLBN-115]|nr:helix-turn-helix protein [Streptomyces sp. SLBN-115]
MGREAVVATEEELFASVDALLDEEAHLPPPPERARLREAAGITQARLAAAMKTSTQSVKNWENGRSGGPGHCTAPRGAGHVHPPGRSRDHGAGDRRGDSSCRSHRPGCRGVVGDLSGDVPASGHVEGCGADGGSAVPARPARRTGRRWFRVRSRRDRAGLPRPYHPGAGGVDPEGVRPRCAEAAPQRQGLRPVDRPHRRGCSETRAPRAPGGPRAAPLPAPARRPPGGQAGEEAYQWVRDVDLLSDEECTLPHAVGLDLNTAFLAAAARLVVGLSAPDHFHAPAFNPKIPGSWLVDLSDIALDPRLPSPCTPDGSRPAGPAWYQTHTVAYAQELGYNVHPLEAYLRRESGAYLDPWHDRLKTAYVDTLADLGVTKDLDDRQFLAAMECHKQADPAMAAVLAAIKATVKGGVGKLRERPQGKSYKQGERWPALERPTWRPDIRAAVISKARVNMHRKLSNMAKMTGLFPLAVLSDCVVYPSPGESPHAFLPYAASGKPQPGGFRLGPTPGLAKLEGVQTMLWAVDLMEQGLNPARHIKGGDAVLDEGE